MMTWLAVAVGGALGALARYGLSLWLAPQPGKFPTATFCANALGCFVMGVFYVLIVKRGLIPLSWQPFLAVGLLGGFTTFSSFSLEAFLLWQHQHLALAMFYVTATLVTCLFAVWAGHFLGGMFSQ